MTTTICRRRLLAYLGLVFVAGSRAASAHHSTAMFDLTRTIKVQGTVEEFEWTNPHTWLWLQVPNASNGTDRWGIEGMSPNYLSRIGWTRHALKAGDKIAADINPLKSGRHGGFCVAITLADGKVLRSRAG